jgi:hypothetical protein
MPVAMGMGEAGKLAHKRELWLWSAPIRDSLHPPIPPPLSYRHRVAQRTGSDVSWMLYIDQWHRG